MGRAEACVWIGDAGSVRRVRARSCAWSGLWTGTATRRASFEAIDVDRARTGVYIEHFTRDSTFRALRIGPRVRIGLAAEWADPVWGRRPASVGNVIEDSRFESRLVGRLPRRGDDAHDGAPKHIRRSELGRDRRLSRRRKRVLRQRLPGHRRRRGRGPARPSQLSQGGIGDGGGIQVGLVRSRPCPRSTASRRWPGNGTTSCARCRARARSCCTAGWPNGGATTGEGAEFAVQVARVDGHLAGALPVVVRRRAGVRVASFMGGRTRSCPTCCSRRGPIRRSPSSCSSACAPARVTSPTSMGCPPAAASPRRWARASG